MTLSDSGKIFKPRTFVYTDLLSGLIILVNNSLGSWFKPDEPSGSILKLHYKVKEKKHTQGVIAKTTVHKTCIFKAQHKVLSLSIVLHLNSQTNPLLFCLSCHVFHIQ